MSRLFTAKEELQEYLRDLNPAYEGYAAELWSKGVNSTDILANGSIERLMARGITNDLHAEDIKARAGTHERGAPAGGDASDAIGVEADWRASHNKLQQQIEHILEPLAEMALDAYEWSEGNMTTDSQRDPDFKHNLVSRYSQQRYNQAGPLIRCMLTNEYLPARWVIGAHILKYKWRRSKLLVLFKVPDINDMINGLLLFKPIEWAFDNSLLVLLPDDIDIRAYLVDPQLQDVTLLSKLHDLTSKHEAPPTPAELDIAEQLLGSMTFGQLHGKLLTFSRDTSSLNSQVDKPATRVLEFHVRQSIRSAKKNNIQHMIPEEALSRMHSTPGRWQQMMQGMLQWVDTDIQSQLLDAANDTAEASVAPGVSQQPISFQDTAGAAATSAAANSGGRKKKKKQKKKRSH